MNAMLDKTVLRGELRTDESMARHTSWRTGGAAERYYIPADLDDVVAFMRQLPASEPVIWVGLGSNLLVRDGGIKGTVIATSGALNNILLLDARTVRAEAGVASAKAARFCSRHDLVGAEFLAGIPGTVGGALAMNAGAFGGETWRIVKAVETIDRAGVMHTRLPDEYEIGYRHVSAKDEAITREWFVAAHLGLEHGDGATAQAYIKTLLAKRGASQPTQTANAGSVFKNPEGDHAARLIDSAGLKGQCVGGACVSDKHANFIINTGGATAADIEQLIEQVQTQVETIHGVVLSPEVRIVGTREAA